MSFYQVLSLVLFLLFMWSSIALAYHAWAIVVLEGLLNKLIGDYQLLREERDIYHRQRDELEQRKRELQRLLLEAEEKANV